MNSNQQCISSVRNECFFGGLIKIKKGKHKHRFQFQFSVHTTNEQQRDRLIPVKNGVKKMVGECCSHKLL